MIQCEFIARPEWLKGKNVRTKNKFGIYHGSFFSEVDGFGRTKWVILAELRVLDSDVVLTEETLPEVVEGCVEYLNQPPPTKRRTKKKRPPPYGTLEHLKSSLKLDEDGNKKILVFLTTDQRRNKYFWGSGPTMPRKKIRIRRI